jgi:hypothetical protein
MSLGEQRSYVSKDIQWFVVSERRGGFVVRSACIQYDLSALPCVLVLVADGGESICVAVAAGRAYLRSARVKLLRKIEPGVVLIESSDLRHGALIFEPGELP